MDTYHHEYPEPIVVPLDSTLSSRHGTDEAEPIIDSYSPEIEIQEGYESLMPIEETKSLSTEQEEDSEMMSMTESQYTDKSSSL